MSAIKRIMERTKDGNAYVKNLFFEKHYYFVWNKPATENEIRDFIISTGIILPEDYCKLLLETNGAILFNSDTEDDGYHLLGLNELEYVNKELAEVGYRIPENYICFCQSLFNNDMLFFDLAQNKNYIVDGDVGYPSSVWKHLSGNLDSFLINLCLSNGGTYWRW